MVKPSYLSTKNYIVHQMAIEMVIPEDILDIIINHQFSSALDALQTNNSVEISGWGTFQYNEKKAKKLLETYIFYEQRYVETLKDDTITKQKRKSSTIGLANIRKDIELLKQKLKKNESSSNI